MFRSKTPPEALSLTAILLEYTPAKRTKIFDAMAHPFFHELRTPGCTFEGKPLPALFNFSPEGSLLARKQRKDGESGRASRIK